MSENIKPLLGKLIITGTITVKTGLAIGGSKSGIDIGALDNPVIKYRNGDKDVPYIPGSSLKGKLRALLAKVAGSKDVDEDKKLTNEFKHLAKVFGYAPGPTDKSSGEALLKVRDSFLKDGNTGETEEKMENSINRITGKANPRPLERVLPETIFETNLCLDVYSIEEVQEHLKLIDLAFELLNQDYLGGGGSRGNGRVQSKLSINKYLKINSENKKIGIDNNTITFEFANGKYEESKDSKPKAE